MARFDPTADAGSTLHRRVPTWKGNLLVFGLLVTIVLAYLYWQVDQAQTAFLQHARAQAGIIAGVIESNAASAVLSQEVVEEIIRTFLGNMARFVRYLDDVEPFSPAELAAFAEEAGLAGIRIHRGGIETTEGPRGWLSGRQAPCGGRDFRLQHLPGTHLYTLALSPEGQDRCFVVGIDAERIERLQDQIGLPRLLETVSGIEGIAYLRIDPRRPDGEGPPGRVQEVGLVEGRRGTVAEARIPTRNGDLVVGIDARQLASRVAGLRQQFTVFASLLAATGLLLSWLLFRLQNAYLGRMRTVERELARQREDAALGRAAASIAHEIRNPLNAISMGLQRLAMETSDPEDTQQELIETMQQAVRRTDGIVADIRRFARPPTPRKRPFRLDEIAGRVLKLYRGACEDRGIEASLEAGFQRPVPVDPDMMAQAVENLVKNAVEAQPQGGFLRVAVGESGGGVVLTVENAGFSAPEGGAEQIVEPYFTTKTRGTGLGLSIARRIAAAHGGSLTAREAAGGVLRIALTLPAEGASEPPAEREHRNE